MREGMLIVPQRDNAGRDLKRLRSQIAADMVDAFGGVTATDATGYWSTPDQRFMMEEPVTQLVSAYEPTPENDSKLRDLALRVGHDGKQIAVYVRYASGNVEIVNTEEPVKLAA